MTSGPGDNPAGGEDGQTPAPGAPAHPAGSMNFQDGSTTPREPDVGEIRARKKARRAHAEQEAADAQAAEAKRKRKRLLIGGAAAVGVVGVVAALYSATPSQDVSARCVDSSGTVVSDNYCGGSGNYGSGGIFFFGGGSYRYNYGGSGGIGQRATGGSSVAPKGSSVSGSSGRSSISRGGLGAGSSHSSGGSSSGS